MNCKQCNEALTGRQREFCSDKCRMVWNRGTKSNEVGSGSPKANSESEQNESEQPTRTASLDDYNASRQDYATRAEPERLNWGPWMSADKLASAGLKANRVTIPGDWDYAGVCKKVDGEWVVKPEQTSIGAITDLDLQLKIKSYPGASWINSPEHQEVLSRRQAARPGPVHDQARAGA